MSSSLNLDEEVRLYTTNAEREKYGMLATLFGIVVKKFRCVDVLGTPYQLKPCLLLEMAESSR